MRDDVKCIYVLDPRTMKFVPKQAAPRPPKQPRPKGSKR